MINMSAEMRSFSVIKQEITEKTLEKYDNNLTEVATVLRVTRQALYRRLEKHNIKLEL